MERIERLKDLIPKLKANKKIHPLKVESLEWELKYLESEKKQLSIYGVNQQRELLKAFLQYVNCSDTDSKVSFDLLDKYLNSL